MKLFLSYPSGQRELAERLTLALEAEGHEVFIDRSELKAGESFHQRLREAVQDAEAMVFLVTPDAVRQGSYALAELNIAQQRWRRPGGHVLPVMVTPTPMATLPPYLSAVTVLEPRGDVVAETVAAVSHLAAPSRAWRLWAVTTAVLGALAAAGGYLVLHQIEQATTARARLAAEQRDLAQAKAARDFCFTGGYAVAMTQLNELAARSPPQDMVLDAREDCAMRWLREMRSAAGKQTTSEQVMQIQPLLLQGLGRTGGERAADLRSHIGWGEYLRSREGVGGLDPLAHWKRALADDASNVYAHAMWARQMLDKPGRLDEARKHFAAAVASGRNRGFVRALQFGASLSGPNELASYAVTVADEMRRGKETIRSDHRDRLWSYAFGTTLFNVEARTDVLASLPPADLLATFNWLFPEAEVSDDRRPLWRFNRATLLAHKGDRVAARVGFESLAGELRAFGQTGRLLDEAQRGADRLRDTGPERGSAKPKTPP